MKERSKVTAKTAADIIPAHILDKITAAIASITYGSVTLIVQDARVIQMEKIEKIRFDAGGSGGHVSIAQDFTQVIRTKVINAINGIRYGQVLMLIKDGKIVQIERTEKQRVATMEGMYGDGI